MSERGGESGLRGSHPRRDHERREHGEGSRPRRWVVERTHSWLNRSRRLLVRWEKKAENYLAFIHLACAQLVFGKLLRLSPGGTP
jgi:transposase